MVSNTRERRSAQHRSDQGQTFNAGTIRHGLFLQHSLNTISAIEYFKSKGVDGSVIQRVLSGTRRQDDLPAFEDAC